MTRTRREELLQLLASGQEGLDESGQMCVLEGRLYLASLASPPTKTAGTIFLTNARAMQYQPYCADFGPFNLGERTVHIRCLCARACAVSSHAGLLAFCVDSCRLNSGRLSCRGASHIRSRPAPGAGGCVVRVLVLYTEVAALILS